MKLFCEHEIEMSADDFWHMIHSELYESQVAEANGLTEYRTVARQEAAHETYRKIQVGGRISDGLRATFRLLSVEPVAGYVEEQWRSKQERSVRFRLTPPVLPQRVEIAGEVRVEPLGPARCRRILQGRVRVRIPVLGRRIERAIIEAAESAYAKAAGVANELAPPVANELAPPVANELAPLA